MSAPWKSIKPAERPLAAALTATYFLIIGAFTLGKIARDSLFLTELPAAYLPYVYVGLAALSAVATVALGRLRGGTAHQRLSLLLAATGASLLLFAGWFRVAPGSAAIAFYLWTGVYGVALVAEFWLVANESIDSRQARRLFGPIGAGGVLGGLVAAAAATAAGQFIEPLWFLVLAAVLYLAGAVLARRVPGSEQAEARVEPAAEGAGGLGGRGLLSGEYTRLLVLVFLTAGVAIGILDYAFKLVLQDQLSDGGKIASALGVFYSVQGLVSIVAQVGLTGFVLSRFGHRAAANALPLGLLLGSALALGLPGVFAPWAILASRLYELALRFSITRTAWEFLYFPLSSEIKAKLKRLIDVVVNRSADALAGLLLLLINATLGGRLTQLAVVLVILVGIWAVLERRLNKAYVREVDRALRRLVPETEERTVELRRSVRVDDLSEQFDSADEGRVLGAMAVLERLDPTAIIESAPKLAVHRSEAVRARLLAVVSAAGGDPDRFEFLAPAADRHSAGAAEGAGLEETADERVAIAAAAGRPGGVGAYGHRLAGLIDDSNDDVRRTALRSVALVGDRNLVWRLVDRLRDARDRRPARQALVLMGKRVVGTLGDYVVDPSVATAMRLHLIPVLEEIGGSEAAHSLCRATSLEGDRRVVDGALRSLLRLRQRQRQLRFPEDQVLEELRLENERNAHRLIQLTTLSQAADAEARGFVDRVLREGSDQSFLRIFRRLSLVHPAGPVMSAYRGLRSGESKTRAQAIEYLETLLPQELARKLLPLLEAEGDEERRAKAWELFGSEPLTLEATLRQLLSSREAWLCACGLHVVGKLGLADHLERAVELSRSDDRLVSETALWAMGRLE